MPIPLFSALPDDVLQYLLRLGEFKGQAAARQTSRSLRGHLDVIQKVNGLETGIQKKWVRLQLEHNELEHNDKRVRRLIDNLDTRELTTNLQQMVNEVQAGVRRVLTEIDLQTQVAEAVQQKILNQPRVWACLDNKLDKYILVGDTNRVCVLLNAGATPTTRSLELAAEFGDGNMVSALLRNGGATPTTRSLELAAEFGDGNMVFALLNAGATPTTRSLELATLTAVRKRDENLIHCFLKQDDPSNKDHRQLTIRLELQKLLDSSCGTSTTEKEERTFILNQCSTYDRDPDILPYQVMVDLQRRERLDKILKMIIPYCPKVVFNATIWDGNKITIGDNSTQVTGVNNEEDFSYLRKMYRRECENSINARADDKLQRCSEISQPKSPPLRSCALM